MPTRSVVWVSCALVFHMTHFACYAGAPPKKRAPIVVEVPTFRAISAIHGCLRADAATWQNAVRTWSVSSASEKLSLADYLLELMGSDEACSVEGYKWQPGTDDLSLPAGRTKWALELILGVKLPFIVDQHASQEYLARLRQQAYLMVEVYRRGVMDSAADHEVSPQELAHLRSKYRGKIAGVSWANGAGVGSMLAMDALLLEWPPIGRKYEDLVSIIGVKGAHVKAGATYKLFMDPSPLAEYRFTLQDGVIYSVTKARD